jgi:uncharacterized membrane protein YdjX (TVP38/TMEM64 family)
VAFFLRGCHQVKQKKALLPIVALFVCAALAATWRWTPLAHWLDVDTVSAWLDSIHSHPSAPYLLLAAFILGSQVMFPITILIFATVYTFGPRFGFAYAMLGSLSAAIVSYWIGCWVGREALRRLAGPRYKSLEEILRKNGLVAVVTTHLIPVGPFTIVNLAAGAVGVPFGHFVAGCTIGLFPGVAIITIFEQQLENALRRPRALPALIAAILLILLAAWVFWARRLAKGDRLSLLKNRPGGLREAEDQREGS